MPHLFDVTDDMIGPVRAARGDSLLVLTVGGHGGITVMREHADGKVDRLRDGKRAAIPLLAPLIEAGVLVERTPGAAAAIRGFPRTSCPIASEHPPGGVA